MANPLPEQMKITYLKSPAFRVIHVDGLLGGITPRGLIHAAIYAERPAIPQVLTHSVTPNGTLGDVIATESRGGIVREMDADLFMTKETAVEIRDWLTDRIAEMEKLQAEAKGREQGNE